MPKSTGPPRTQPGRGGTVSASCRTLAWKSRDGSDPAYLTAAVTEICPRDELRVGMEERDLVSPRSPRNTCPGVCVWVSCARLNFFRIWGICRELWHFMLGSVPTSGPSRVPHSAGTVSCPAFGGGGGGEGEGATSAVQGASGRPRPFLIPRPGRVRAAGGTPTRPRRPLHLGCPKASSAAGSKEDLGPIRALRATRIFPKPSK